MISDAAISAAARAYRGQQTELGYPKWEDLPEDGREWRRGYMRAALEAAAPFIAAEAWHRGYVSALQPVQEPVVRHTKTDPACRYYRYREPRNPISRYLDRRARGKSCPACVPANPYRSQA